VSDGSEVSGEEDGSGIRLGIWAIIAQANGESDRPFNLRKEVYASYAFQMRPECAGRLGVLGVCSSAVALAAPACYTVSRWC
jgi:hypothetical protein